jgi:hypothetical protein
VWLWVYSPIVTSSSPLITANRGTLARRMLRVELHWFTNELMSNYSILLKYNNVVLSHEW